MDLEHHLIYKIRFSRYTNLRSRGHHVFLHSSFLIIDHASHIVLTINVCPRMRKNKRLGAVVGSRCLKDPCFPCWNPRKDYRKWTILLHQCIEFELVRSWILSCQPRYFLILSLFLLLLVVYHVQTQASLWSVGTN